MFSENKKHFYSLDLFRGISGYGVAITHFFAFIYSSEVNEYLSFIFVEFFFVLSGFVLFPQILKVYDDKRNLFLFYQRRWLRTLPLFFFSLIVISLILNQMNSSDFFKYFFLIQNMFANFLSKNYYPIVWSLSIEEFFYLIFPFMLILTKKENLIKCIIFFLLLTFLMKVILSNFYDSNFLRTGTFFRLDAILLGFCARFFYNEFKIKFSLTLSLLLLLLYFLCQEFVINNRDSYLVKIFFIYYLQFLSLNFLLFFLNLENFLYNKYLKFFLQLISNQTYSVYLFHMIYIYLLYDVKLLIIYKFLIYISLLFFTSTVAYYFFEKPILKNRKQLI